MGIHKVIDHQDLIDAVNDVITNPPDECSGLSALTKPEESVIFKVSSEDYATWDEIRGTMDTYAQINSGHTPCGPLTWAHPPTLDNNTIWKQETIDEIHANLSTLGDCECACTPIPCTEDDGTEIVIYEDPLRVFSNCEGQFPPEQEDDTYDVCTDVDGLMVAPAGCAGRSYGLTRRIDGFTYHDVTNPPTTTGLGGGSISCEGIASCSGPITSLLHSGIAVGGPCDEETTLDDLADAHAALSGKSLKIVLHIFATEIGTEKDTDCDGEHDCEEGGDEGGED